MAASPFFSGRIPQKLFDAIEDHRQQTGESKTDVLIKALSNYVGAPIDTSHQVKEGFDERVVDLEVRVRKLENSIAELHQPISTAIEPGSISIPADGQLSFDDIQPSNEVENEVEEGKGLSTPDNNGQSRLNSFSINQMAELTGMNPEAVRSRQKRGREIQYEGKEYRAVKEGKYWKWQST